MPQRFRDPRQILRCFAAIVYCFALLEFHQISSATMISRMVLRGGEAEKLTRSNSNSSGRAFAVSKLTRSYSVSSITPTAADPTHLEQDITSGPLDLNVITSLLDSSIQIKITSTHGAELIKSTGNSLMLHWGVDTEDNGEWNRPPKQMLPPGTSYRFQKKSVQTPFKLNADGKAEVVLCVPDTLAPKKLRFIIFVMGGGEEAKFWFKNSNEGDFEVYVCPDIWHDKIEARKAKQGGGLGLLTKLIRPARLPSVNVTEIMDARAPSPPRELEGHWRPHRHMERSHSAEMRHLLEQQRAVKIREAVARHRDDRTHVKVSVMMPLDMHKWRIESLERRVRALKQAGVHGIMCDVWWGLVEQEPRRYDFGFYLELARMAQRVGVEVEFVMSFHKCGGNVGDNCHIPLPHWLLEAAAKQGKDRCFYTDRKGYSNDEYISGAADEHVELAGRTPLQAYTEFMEAFADTFCDFFHTVITKIQIGLGPAGELRYPSFPLSKWCYPGPGSFQCYDKHMLASWAAHCHKAGHHTWEKKLPDTGDYNTPPDGAPFFRREFESEYGRNFLQWYSGELIAHGDRVLGRANSIFGPYKVEISGKVAGLHWLYLSRSHAAECAAGYYNTNGHNAYAAIANMLRRHGATFDFTCFEIQTGRDVPEPYLSDPEALVWQAKCAAEKAGVRFAGENALEIEGWEGYDTILKKGAVLDSFCFLRLTDSLLQGRLPDFKAFVSRLVAMRRPLHYRNHPAPPPAPLPARPSKAAPSATPVPATGAAAAASGHGKGAAVPPVAVAAL